MSRAAPTLALTIHDLLASECEALRLLGHQRPLFLIGGHFRAQGSKRTIAPSVVTRLVRMNLITVKSASFLPAMTLVLTTEGEGFARALRAREAA